MSDRILEEINRNDPDDSQVCSPTNDSNSSIELVDIPERNDLEELQKRLEETQERRESDVVRFNLSDIKKHFDESVEAVEKEFDIADLVLSDKGIEYAEAIWKSQLLFLESAFDFFMHELNRFSLTSMYEEEWPQTKEYEKIKVPLNIVEKVLKTGEPVSWFMELVIDTYKGYTMVSKKGFEKQLELMGINKNDVAKRIYPELSSKEGVSSIYETLDSLYERRNYLIHQANRKHEDATFYKEKVTKEIVKEYIEFVRMLVDALISISASI